MTNRLSGLLSALSVITSEALSNDRSRKRALVTGSVAASALVTGLVLRTVRRNSLQLPESLPGAVDAPVAEMEMMEGQARYYHRDGEGRPLVFLHSINAAASSFEMRPLFDLFARETSRPLFALDWLGFGRSDRPPVHYSPALYQRQLRRFLSEHVRQPADVVAFSLGCEFAAVLATALPFLFHRLVFLAPTGLSQEDEGSLLRRVLVGATDGIGAFEAFFALLTRRGTLRRFYEERVFTTPADVPDGLADYAFQTTHVRGAHHAPRRFVEGTLFLGQDARTAYTHLTLPTLFVIPSSGKELVQSFERAEEVVSTNNERLTLIRSRSGLMPQWDRLTDLASPLMTFLS